MWAVWWGNGVRVSVLRVGWGEGAPARGPACEGRGWCRRGVDRQYGAFAAPATVELVCWDRSRPALGAVSLTDRVPAPQPTWASTGAGIPPANPRACLCALRIACSRPPAVGLAARAKPHPALGIPGTHAHLIICASCSRRSSSATAAGPSSRLSAKPWRPRMYASCIPVTQVGRGLARMAAGRRVVAPCCSRASAAGRLPGAAHGLLPQGNGSAPGAARAPASGGKCPPRWPQTLALPAPGCQA